MVENGTKLPLSHRPKKSGSGKRQKQKIIGFRGTAEERAALQAGADAADLTLSSYIRKSMLKAPQTRLRRRPLADVAALAAAITELGRIGGNINQITRRVNMGDTPLAAEFREAMKGLLETMKAIRAAMGLEK